MWDKIVIGVDNGSSGTVGFVRVKGSELETQMFLTPTRTEQNYTKKASNIKRLDYDVFLAWLEKEKAQAKTVMAYMERPFTGMFTNTAILAARCFEAQLLAMEHAKVPHRIIDSKEWQKVMLPKGLTGSKELKKASMDIGMRVLPSHADLIKKHGDADGFLIALWAVNCNLVC